jgi:hypothetical protein
MALIEGNDIDGFRRVIDLSADSAANTSGPPIEVARDEVVAAGITINGLAVLCRHCSGRPINYDLEAAFADRVIGGPGSFVVTADNPSTFADAVRRKLILEIAGNRTDRPVRLESVGLLGRAAGDLPRNRFRNGVAYR